MSLQDTINAVVNAAQQELALLQQMQQELAQHMADDDSRQQQAAQQQADQQQQWDQQRQQLIQQQQQLQMQLGQLQQQLQDQQNQQNQNNQGGGGQGGGDNGPEIVEISSMQLGKPNVGGLITGQAPVTADGEPVTMTLGPGTWLVSAEASFRLENIDAGNNWGLYAYLSKASDGSQISITHGDIFDGPVSNLGGTWGSTFCSAMNKLVVPPGMTDGVQITVFPTTPQTAGNVALQAWHLLAVRVG